MNKIYDIKIKNYHIKTKSMRWNSNYSNTLTCVLPCSSRRSCEQHMEIQITADAAAFSFIKQHHS